MTDQQQKITDALLKLPKDLIEVVFIYRDDCGRNKEKTRAVKNSGGVRLYLVEPENPFDLSEWAEAIVRAEELAQIVEDERTWEMKNPDFFKALYAKYRYKK